MWSAVAPPEADSPAPSARSKHSASLVGDYVYLVGGRNGNLPLKDFWKYNIVTGKWQQIKASGDKLPSLQEHSAVAYRDSIYVFGGEVGFSAGTETPLWVYDIKANSWRKIKSKKGVATPKGRRGHTALVHRGYMLIYGGYQDLRGSCNELWAFHFETESWHLLSSFPTKTLNTDCYPPPRHKHSAILHNDAMWIYGGMTDLQERSDFWKFDVVSKNWMNIKTKLNPGALHSHAACKLPSSMIIFGGERGGHPTNELWRFTFSTETWEKICIEGVKPQPRCESIAFTVSELLLKDPTGNSLESKSVRIRARTCNSADRGSRHSSYLPNNKVAPSEKTYMFSPSQTNYIDGSEIAQQYAEDNSKSSKSFLQEISKLSQLNISRLNNKCNYTVLSGCTTDSTESLLKQHASPQAAETEMALDLAVASPAKSTMVKSKSAYVIKKKYNTDISPNSSEEEKRDQAKKRVDFESNIKKISREPISVPNFSVLNLPTPVLTPVEATKLVYLDTDEETELGINLNEKVTQIKSATEEPPGYENFKPVKRGESYSSHLAYADNPLYQHMINSSNVRFDNYTVQEKFDGNVSSTSDYASIETVNRLSSASNYSVKTNTPQDENQKNKERDKEGPFGFCNPNYMSPDIKSMLNNEIDKKNMASFLIHQDNKLDYKKSNGDGEVLELQTYNGVINRNARVVFKTSHSNGPPKSLDLETTRPKQYKCRALSASRVERNKLERSCRVDQSISPPADPFLPLYIYIIGGKEQHVTVFARPISIWKLKLF